MWLNGARYSRQGKEITNVLKNATVAIFGLGGTGSFVAVELARAGVGNLIISDPDRIEESNLNRQILYFREDVGKLKVDVAEKRIKEHNPEVKIEKHVIDEEVPITKVDIAVECADNIAAKKRILKMVVDVEKPVVATSSHIKGGFVALITSKETLGKLKFGLEKSQVVAPYPGIIGSLAALIVIKYLLGDKEEIFYYFDGKEFKTAHF